MIVFAAVTSFGAAFVTPLIIVSIIFTAAEASLSEFFAIPSTKD